MRDRQHAVNSEKRSPAGDALSALVVRVIRLAGRLTAEGDRLARPSGQSSARWQLLAAAEAGPQTVAAIARYLGLARQSVQRVADVLTDEGLVAWEENPDDRRAQVLRLAPRGRAALTQIQRAQKSWAEKLGARLGRAELARAGVTLDRLLELLDEKTE